MLIRMIRTHLAARSAFWLLLIVGLVGLLFLLLARALTASFEQERQLSQLEELLATVENTASIAAFLEDPGLAEEVVTGLLNNRTVQRASLRAGTRLLASGIRDGAPAVQTDAMTADTQQGISRSIYSPFDSGEQVGQLDLAPDFTEIQANVAQTTRFVSLMVLVLMVAIVVGVFSVVFLQVTRPILSISHRLHGLKAETGEKLEFPRGNQIDEIGQLVRDVNALIDNLVGRIRQEADLRGQIEVEKERFQTIYENAGTGIFQIRDDGTLLSCNAAFRQTFGLPPSAQVEAGLWELLQIQPDTLAPLIERSMRAHRSATGTFELTSADGGGTKRWIQVVLNPLSATELQGIANDVSESKRSEQAAHSLAVTDVLTRLPNRLGFEQALARLLERQSRVSDTGFALIMLDLDHFKPVNDTYGHPAGDRLLKLVASMLRQAVREDDICARLGGDEFAILLPSTQNKQAVAVVADKLVKLLNEPIDIGEGITVHISASVGIALFDQDAEDSKQLVARADEALYAAKAEGRNQYRFYQS